MYKTFFLIYQNDKLGSNKYLIHLKRAENIYQCPLDNIDFIDVRNMYFVINEIYVL